MKISKRIAFFTLSILINRYSCADNIIYTPGGIHQIENFFYKQDTKLDLAIANKYSLALALTDEKNRKAIESSQLKWSIKRDECLDEKCLTIKHQQRMRELDITLNHGQDKTCLRNILDISPEGEKIDSVSYGANLTLTDLNHDNQKEYMINYACGAQNECRFLYISNGSCFKLIGEFLGTGFKPRARTIGKAGAYTDIWLVTSGGYCGYGAWYKFDGTMYAPAGKGSKIGCDENE